MKRLISLLLIVIFSISIVGCSKRNSPEVEKTTEENSKKTTENVEKEKAFSDEEYKNLIVKNYEKYLKPIDIKDEELDNVLDKNKDLTNEQIVENYRQLLIDSQSNIESFKEAISNLKIENKELQDLNNALIKDSHNLIEDIIKKTDAFNSVNEDLLKGSKKSLINHIDNELDKDLTAENNFDNTLEKIEEKLGIDLDK